MISPNAREIFPIAKRYNNNKKRRANRFSKVILRDRITTFGNSIKNMPLLKIILFSLILRIQQVAGFKTPRQLFITSGITTNLNDSTDRKSIPVYETWLREFGCRVTSNSSLPQTIAKKDLGCTPVKLIVDTPLSLPIFYFYGNSNLDSNLTTQFIRELHKWRLQCTLSRHTTINMYFQAEHHSYEHVLKRNEVRKNTSHTQPPKSIY